MEQQWEKDLTITKLIVKAIYGAVFIHAWIVFFRTPPVPYVWEQTQQTAFFGLLAAVVPMFLISALLGKRLLNPERLSEKFLSAERGLGAVLSQVRTVGFAMAAMGEACAIFGLILYLQSGDVIRPWIFFALSALHYPITMTRLTKACAEIKNLSRNQ